MVGIVIFLVGSALCGATTSMNMLFIFRALQGLGGAGMQSSFAMFCIAITLALFIYLFILFLILILDGDL